MKKKKSFIRAANALLFTSKELLVLCGAVFVLMLLVLPVIYEKNFKVTLKEDFRLPYVNRDNYYLYSCCAEAEANRCKYLFLGDSAIWGMYASNAGTLPEQINQLLQGKYCGNISIDGLHPVAMRTLVQNFAKGVTGKTVLLYFNPLWVNSEKYDLSGKEPYTVNHPELVPQFGNIASYDADFDKRIGIVLDRYLPFFSLKRHWQNYFYGNSDLKSFLIQNPSGAFFDAIQTGICPEEKEHKGSTENYRAKGIPLQHWDWVKLSTSRQFAALIDTAHILTARGNQFFVMIGTINPGLLDDATRQGLAELRKDAEMLLRENGISSIMMPEIDAKLYADASHPLESGYAELAKFLVDQKIVVK